jgi:peptidoglycan lytic transglycosylase
MRYTNLCLLSFLLLGGKPREAQEGRATFVGSALEGKRTASGEIFRNADLVAAHPYLPFGTVVWVTNLENGKTVVVRIVDRLPRSKGRRKVVIDLSRAAARILGFGVRKGTAKVRVDVVGPPTPRWQTPEPERSQTPPP